MKERMEQLERKLSETKNELDTLRTRGEQLRDTVVAKVKQLKALPEEPEKLSDDLKQRAQLFHTNEEAKQLEALRDVEKMKSRDEALLACGMAAKDSAHAAVRRRALAAAVSLGDDGFAAMALAYESLGGADRVYLAKELGKRKSPDLVLFFIHMAKDADAELLKTLLDIDQEPQQRLLFLTAIAESQMNDAFYEQLVAIGTKLPGDAGLAILFALASKGPEKHAAAAVTAAVSRKEDAWPVIAAGFKNARVPVREAVVRGAKKLGGELGDFVVKTALAESDADLRAAAETAAK